jgi:hypothetical protein
LTLSTRAVNDCPDYPHAQVLEVDILPFERQHLFRPEAGTLRHHDHHPVGLRQQIEDLIILLDGQHDRLLLPLADALDLYQLHRIPLPCDDLP